MLRCFLACLVLVAAGCGDDDSCGPGDAAGGLTLELPGGAGTITFGALHAGLNNDCTPVQGDPTSVTIQGDQTDPAGNGFVTLCLPRPHELGDGPIAFDDADQLQMIAFQGRDAEDCQVVLDDARPLGGASAGISGFCDEGASPDGFALSLAGTLPVTRTCGDVADPVDAALGGTAPVMADEI